MNKTNQDDLKPQMGLKCNLHKVEWCSGADNSTFSAMFHGIYLPMFVLAFCGSENPWNCSFYPPPHPPLCLSLSKTFVNLLPLSKTQRNNCFQARLTCDILFSIRIMWEMSSLTKHLLNLTNFIKFKFNIHRYLPKEELPSSFLLNKRNWINSLHSQLIYF